MSKETKELYYIATFGCQMNIHDSEKIAALLYDCGYTEAEEMKEASLILINTCNVRPKAVQKAYSMLGTIKDLKTLNSNLIIGLCGCVPQTEKKEVFTKASMVDLVFGTQNIENLPKLLERVKKEKKKQIEIISNRKDSKTSPQKVIREDSVRAWVTIIEGCDNFCTYCIVPFTRGREVSRPAEDIVLEVRALVDEGYKEVALLGQNVNSYGLKESFDTSFPDLLRKVSSIKGLHRIRFVTSHPKDFSDDLIDVMSEFDNICNQIHLPVQTGSDKLLLLMGRKYTRNEYLEKVNRLKQKVGDIGITSDVIVGFPGETEEDFEETLSLLREVRYDGVYSYKYYDRPKTKASEISEKVPIEVINDRFTRLINLQKEISIEKNAEEEGKEIEVLVEGHSKNDKDILSGRTEKNKIVNFKATGLKKGDLARVRILEGKPNCLIGELISPVLQ